MADLEFYVNFLNENMKLIVILLGIGIVLIAMIIFFIIKSIKTKIKANRTENMVQFAYKNGFNILDSINGEKLISKSNTLLRDTRKVTYSSIIQKSKDHINYLIYDCKYFVGNKSPYIEFYQTVVQVKLENKISNFFLNKKTLANSMIAKDLIKINEMFDKKYILVSTDRSIKSIFDESVVDYLIKTKVEMVIETSGGYINFYNHHKLINSDKINNTLTQTKDILRLIDKKQIDTQ